LDGLSDAALNGIVRREQAWIDGNPRKGKWTAEWQERFQLHFDKMEAASRVLTRRKDFEELHFHPKRFGARIDPGLRELIFDLNLAGIVTDHCCQGKLNCQDVVKRRHAWYAYISFAKPTLVRRIIQKVRQVCLKVDWDYRVVRAGDETLVLAEEPDKKDVPCIFRANANFERSIRRLFLTAP
jgi:hypothetical protein